jgi:GT2 family glycosyltransferase
MQSRSRPSPHPDSSLDGQPARAPSPRISLVVSTRNRSAQLGAHLESVRRLTFGRAWEYVVVDNGSTDGTRDVLEAFRAAYWGSMTIVDEPVAGLSRGKNAGWRAARGEIVAFTDDDCYPAPDYLEAMSGCFDEDERLGYVGGRVVLYDPTDFPISVITGEARLAFPPGSFAAGEVGGGNMAIRREALVATRGFDERLGAGTRFPSEDVDLHFRLSASGWPGVYDPRPLIFHHHRRKTHEEVARLMDGYDRGRGAYYAAGLLRPRDRAIFATHVWRKWSTQNPRRTVREVAAVVEFFLRHGLSGRRHPSPEVEASTRLSR